jgi:hypothetical protein
MKTNSSAAVEIPLLEGPLIAICLCKKTLVRLIQERGRQKCYSQLNIGMKAHRAAVRTGDEPGIIFLQTLPH